MDGNESAEDMHFFYDAQSRTALVEYNGVKYRYIHNLQGDIVGIVDGNGTLVVEYKYDAWGKPISTTRSMAGTLGRYNPFRFRGYVWDQETELYYLRSRCYLPEYRRFISPDSQSEGETLLGSNLYLYCLNDPSNRSDCNGMRSTTVLSDMPIAHDVPKDSVKSKECLTRDAVNQLLANAAIAKKQVKDICETYSSFGERLYHLLVWFKNQVNHNAVWDYKREKRTPKWFSDHSESKVIVNDTEMGMEDFGNFNYGFVGYAMGIPRSILIFGSVYAHYTSHGDYNDDQHDWDMIDAGIETAKQYQERGLI